MTIADRANIILIGFMACGKSRIGAILAEDFGFKLIDLDSLIEADAGLPIKDIFDQKGESYFRACEAQAIKNLEGVNNAVIVTGGGAPMFFDNAQNLTKLGHIFFLDANFAIIKRRLAKNQKRPLGKISNEDEQVNLRSLYAYRRPIYTRLGHVVDVNSEDKMLIRNDIMERFSALEKLGKLRKTTIDDINDSYPIFHQVQSLSQIGTIIASLGLSHYRPIIITTDRLATAIKPAIQAISQSLKMTPAIVTFSDGEQYKNLSSIARIHEQMFELSCTRLTLVIALGGGNVGDVAGFAAGIFLRGVPFIQVPTTLLSMVDASIGGKTGVDNEHGKNLLGLFHNPKAVIIDSGLLKTLPPLDFACGMAEIIKHAIIGDKELFYALNNNLDINEIIERALRVKADIVFLDPKERNIRAHLNLGHTFAHAIEKVSNFEIKHGTAVAMGLVLATSLAKRLGILEEDFLPDLINLLHAHGLPSKVPAHFKASVLIDAMKHDKKRDTKGLKFILPKKLGEVVITHVDEQDIFARGIVS
jgi:shikimate kinase / 3-dehydroquinate synthase